MRVTMLLLAACGPTVVAPELQGDVSALQAAYAETSGETLALPVAASFVVDTTRVTSTLDDTPGTIVAGLWDARSREVVMPEREWLEASGVRVSYRNVLAHEWGHALGLKHSAAGIMRADGDPSCNGRETECLRAAIEQQGSH